KANLNAYAAQLASLEARESKTKEDYERIVELYKMIAQEEKMIKDAKKSIKEAKKVEFVKRDAVKKIVAAWIITVPAAAVLAAVLFFMIKGIML
ncbi:MAG: inorganic phosphate transporter, partial [Epsilonproteobacteria bacterium]|nr:inorganic phosphate transporter [Campylobacterota bacterium]